MARVTPIIHEQVPSTKLNDAYLKLSEAATQALFLALESALQGKGDDYRKARKALDDALNLAVKFPEVAERLSEIPEIRAEAASDFRRSSRADDDMYTSLMADLDEGFGSEAAFRRWYASKKDSRDAIGDLELRNKLYDKVREVKRGLRRSP